MPYYSWQGVKLDAAYYKGVSFARDPQALKNALLEQEIALLSCKQKIYVHLTPISSEQKLFFFQHVHALIGAGIHVWQALHILCEQMSDARLAHMCLQIADAVQEGKALHEALADHEIFSSEMIHVVQIGAEADNLPVALHMLCNHLEDAQAFKKQVRSVLLLPVCTLAVFLVVMLVVLLVIIPKYVQLFVSMSKEVPGITRMLMRMSNFVASLYMIGAVFIAVTCGMVIVQLLKRPEIKKKVDEFVLHVPYIGTLIKHIALVSCLRSLSLLLQGGMPLVPALAIAKEAVSNSCIKQAFTESLERVKAGQDLSYALQMYPALFSQDIILLLAVGQETGCLQEMVGRAADMYAQKVRRRLQRFVFIVQPVLMLVLGLLVAALICAVYMPLFNLADLG